MSQEKDRLKRDYLNEDAIRKLLGISEGNLERLIRDKDFPYIKLGQNKLFSEQDVILWMRQQKHGHNSKDSV